MDEGILEEKLSEVMEVKTHLFVNLLRVFSKKVVALLTNNAVNDRLEENMTKELEGFIRDQIGAFEDKIDPKALRLAELEARASVPSLIRVSLYEGFKMMPEYSKYFLPTRFDYEIYSSVMGESSVQGMRKLVESIRTIRSLTDEEVVEREATTLLQEHQRKMAALKRLPQIELVD